VATGQFVIDGICHPYYFSEENLKGRFGCIFNDVLYAFHPLLNPPETALSKDEWQHDWHNEEVLQTMFLESDTDKARRALAESKSAMFRTIKRRGRQETVSGNG
jgi:hypothetical protein